MMGWNFLPWLRMPASGDVWQKVTNVTDWFSPKLEMNFAGDPRIEQEVNETVASYGRQLGLLTEALLALAPDASAKEKAELPDALARLRDFAARIEAIKDKYTPDAEAAAREALDRLKRADGEAFARVLATYR